MNTSARNDEDAGGSADVESGAPQGDPVEIRVNGERRSVPRELTVAELLERLDVDGRGVAVEHNRRVVPREERDEVALQDGDRVEIVQFVGGG